MLREFLIFVLFSTWGSKRLIGRRSSLKHKNASRHVIDTWERSIFFSPLSQSTLSVPPLPSLSYEPHQLYFPFISESHSTTGHFVAPRIAPNLKRSVLMIAAQGLFTAQTVSAGYANRITCHWQKGLVRNTGKYSCFTSLNFRVFSPSPFEILVPDFEPPPPVFYNVLLYLFVSKIEALSWLFCQSFLYGKLGKIPYILNFNISELNSQVEAWAVLSSGIITAWTLYRSLNGPQSRLFLARIETLFLSPLARGPVTTPTELPHLPPNA